MQHKDMERAAWPPCFRNACGAQGSEVAPEKEGGGRRGGRGSRVARRVCGMVYEAFKNGSKGARCYGLMKLATGHTGVCHVILCDFLGFEVVH